MRGGAIAAAAALLGLAGCGDGDEQSPLNNVALAETVERLAEAPREKDSQPPPPALLEVRREDLERELRARAGCDFSEGGRLLFAAVSGDAIARVNGRLLHFAATGPAGPTGGFFTSGSFSISIGRLTETGVTVEETTTWPAHLVLTDRGREQDRELRLQGAWRCGA